jgi:hypothetical protein
MRHKREAARAARRQDPQRRATEVRARRVAATESDPERDVAPWLRQLGFRADEVRRAAALCMAIPEASLEERVRFAVSSLARGGRRRGQVAPLGSTPRSSALAPPGRCPAPAPPWPP